MKLVENWNIKECKSGIKVLKFNTINKGIGCERLNDKEYIFEDFIGNEELIKIDELDFKGHVCAESYNKGQICFYYIPFESLTV